MLRIVDLEGNQAVDTLFFNATRLDDRYSANDTIRRQGALYLTTGTGWSSSEGRTLLSIVADTCGRHDTIGGACSAESNQVRYALEKKYMHSCRDSFLLALARYGRGMSKRDLASNINFFMNVPVTPQRRAVVRRWRFGARAATSRCAQRWTAGSSSRIAPSSTILATATTPRRFDTLWWWGRHCRHEDPMFPTRTHRQPRRHRVPHPAHVASACKSTPTRRLFRGRCALTACTFGADRRRTSRSQAPAIESYLRVDRDLWPRRAETGAQAHPPGIRVSQRECRVRRRAVKPRGYAFIGPTPRANAGFRPQARSSRSRR